MTIGFEILLSKDAERCWSMAASLSAQVAQACVLVETSQRCSQAKTSRVDGLPRDGSGGPWDG